MNIEQLEEMTIAELAEYARALREAVRTRVRLPRAAHGHVNVQRGQVVAGTGRADVVTDPDVRALVADLQAAGATISRAGDSHWRVEYEGRTANISSTPRSSRSVLNDRARVRRKLGVKV